MDFECHITCRLRDKEEAAKWACHFGWHTSEIERDPVLGKDSYFYLTTHATDYAKILIRMNAMADTLRLEGVDVVREKIELIMYDTKKRPDSRFG